MLSEAIYYVDKHILEIVERDFALIENGVWSNLYQQKFDNTLWRLDEWDKYQEQYLVKLETRNNWADFDATDLKLELLKKTRGTTENKCQWAACERLALNGLVFCEIHAYEMGIRK